MKELGKTLLYLIVFMSIQVVIGGLVNSLWTAWKGNDTPLDSTALTITVIISNVVSIAFFLLARWAVVSRQWMQTRPWTVLFWCVLAAFGAIIPSSWFQEQLPELPNVVEDELAMILGSRAGYFAVGLLAPLAEEMVFRGAILRVLLNMATRGSATAHKGRVWMAIALSALLFAAAHFNPAQLPHAFLIGLLLGWFYWRTGSIVPGVAFHWVNNTIAYVLYQFYPDPQITLLDLFAGNQRSVLMAVGFSLCILIPALFQLNQRMKRA